MTLVTLMTQLELAASVAKLAIAVGVEAAPYVEQVYRLITGGEGLTDDERAALEAKQAELEDLIAAS